MQISVTLLLSFMFLKGHLHKHLIPVGLLFIYLIVIALDLHIVCR